MGPGERPARARLAVPAGAQAAATNFTCRGSAAAVSLGTQTIDPLVANNDNDPCKSAGATIPSLAAKDALGPNTVDATSQTAFAITALGNEGGPVYNQVASTQAGIENLDLNLGGGALHIQAQAVYAAAGAKCSAPNGTVQFPTYVKLIGLTINDQKVVGGEDASIPLSSSLTLGVRSALGFAAGRADHRPHGEGLSDRHRCDRRGRPHRAPRRVGLAGRDGGAGLGQGRRRRRGLHPQRRRLRRQRQRRLGLRRRVRLRHDRQRVDHRLGLGQRRFGQRFGFRLGQRFGFRLGLRFGQRRPGGHPQQADQERQERLDAAPT